MATEQPLHDELAPFRVEVRVGPERAVVAPYGELDLTTCGELEQRLHELAAEHSGEIVVDLRGLTFMSSVGLQLLLTFQGDLGAERFGVVDGSEPVRRLFDLTGVREQLRLVG